MEATILAVVPASNGFVDIQTDQGPLGTKYAEAIAEAQAHIGQRVLIAYQMGEAGQGRNGQWYPPRRYFKRVASPGYVQAQAQPTTLQPQQAMPQPHAPQAWEQPVPQQGPTQAEKDIRIMRQAAAKCAVWTMPLVPSEQRTFQNQLAIAEAWVRYFIGGVEGTGLSLGSSPQAQPQQGPSDAALTQEQQMMAMAGAGAPDDIPFAPAVH